FAYLAYKVDGGNTGKLRSKPLSIDGQGRKLPGLDRLEEVAGLLELMCESDPSKVVIPILAEAWHSILLLVDAQGGFHVALAGDAVVIHCRLHGLMAHQGGDRRPGYAPIPECDGERVAEHVRGQIGEADPCTLVIGQDLLDTADLERSALTVEHGALAVSVFRMAEDLERFPGNPAERNPAWLAPLTGAHVEPSLAWGHLDIKPSQVDELGHSKAGFQEDLDDGQVPGSRRGPTEELVQLLAIEPPDHALAGLLLAG